MKILIVGNGGREHAMARALTTGASAPQVLIAPGNPGTAEVGVNVTLGANTVGAAEDLAALAAREQVDLVIPGPEVSLVAGVADALQARGIACCGPKRAPAQLEASKAFSRELCAKLGLPQPHFVVIRNVAQLDAALATWQGAPPVVKADGLAAGKGVFLPDTVEECRATAKRLLDGELGEAGKTVLLEERLIGPEASLFFACSGEHAVALPHARDHKRLSDADKGPNTGGMGAISPNPQCDPQLENAVRAGMVQPVLRALAAQGTPFCGFLFVGLMLTQRGPQLLEFNVRLGDPEAQAILPRLMPGEFLRLCMATAQDKLAGFTLQVDPHPTCVIVLTAAGYPEAPRKGDAIQVDPQLAAQGRWLIHAGTEQHQGTLRTSGGRVAAVVAQGDSVQQARAHAYAGAAHVHFAGMHMRHDIGENHD